jgi:hypothetical protein
MGWDRGVREGPVATAGECSGVEGVDRVRHPARGLHESERARSVTYRGPRAGEQCPRAAGFSAGGRLSQDPARGDGFQKPEQGGAEGTKDMKGSATDQRFRQHGLKGD